MLVVVLLPIVEDILFKNKKKIKNKKIKKLWAYQKTHNKNK